MTALQTFLNLAPDVFVLRSLRFGHIHPVAVFCAEEETQHVTGREVLRAAVVSPYFAHARRRAGIYHEQ